MTGAPDQILTVARMQAAEQAVMDAGSSVDALMQVAGRGAAEWVWRLAGHHGVTVLCGPGNNGGDGYVIAEAIRERGGKVAVIAAFDPKTDAARNARALYRGQVHGPGVEAHGEVLVDCLFGSGLTRPLRDEHATLLARLAAGHRRRVAIDLPSGVQADTGALLNDELPRYDLTVALGAWKFAHWLMPASARMGALRLVDIGIDEVAAPETARLIGRPPIAAPGRDAHKYTRGLVLVVAGALPGAALLACEASTRTGAGAVRLAGTRPDPAAVSPDIILRPDSLAEQLADQRTGAVLVGPGLGRDDEARRLLRQVLDANRPTVIDADALVLLGPAALERPTPESPTPGSPIPESIAAPRILTPHDGEMKQLLHSFGCDGPTKPERALTLAKTAGAVVIAKGPDTVVAAPDGRLAIAPPATSWLSVAGSGDVLAGIAAARLAVRGDPFGAACEAVWLHGEAARISPPAFTASDLAGAVPAALAACL